MCVLSAVIAVLVILAACIAEITIYYFKPEWLNIWSGGGDIKNDTLNFSNVDGGGGSGLGNNNETILNEVIEQANGTLIGNLTNVLIATANNGTTTPSTVSADDGENMGLSINGTIFVIFAATVGLLAAISAGLLLHLCFFHVYISYLGLTTYEYIRQQRTTNVTYPPSLYQQKNGTTTTHKKENGSSIQGNNGMNPDNATNRRFTSFFRSKSAEADFYFCSNVNPTVQVPIETIDIESQNRPKTLYCCDRVESHHHRHKAYYMCSVMEDNPVAENSMRDLSRINYYPDDEARYESKTFHCCSEFVESTTDNQGFNPGENAITGTVTGMLEQSRREAFLHYTEQCTFCSFRIKTPAKRQHISLEDKRCCIKTVAKHHRWRRKWNCCSNVPDSPDVPMGTQPVPQQVLPSTTVLNVRTLNEQNPVPTMLQQQSTTNNDQRNNNTEVNSNTNTTISYEENSANNNNVSVINGNNNTQPDTFLMNRHSPNNNTMLATTNGNESDIQQILTISSSLSNVSSSSTTTIMPPSSSSSNNATPSKRIRVRGIRPVIRLRHMFRVLGKRYRRPRCRHSGAPGVQVKQNQIRPLPGTEEATNTNYNGSTPFTNQEESNNGQYSTITHQTILPTSAIRNETIVTSLSSYNQQQQYTLPALPPPQRRKIRTTEDIQDLADTLTLVQQTTTTTPSTIIRLSTPNVSNSNIFHSNGIITHQRRQSRRKQILRPRSPTLSPIHESGLSNPTSPLPCHRQNSGETPDGYEEDEDVTTSSISSLTNAHLAVKMNISPNVSPNKRQVKV